MDNIRADASAGEVTRLLNEVARGHKGAEERLIPLVYAELRKLAGHYMRAESASHTLQPTALVHEAYLRLAGPTRTDWESRAHFFGVAAKVMRQILVDHARSRDAAKRGGGVTPLPLDKLGEGPGTPATPVDLLDLDEALTRLALLDERQARIVELRYFTGLTVEDTAQLLDLSPRTVKREWRLARAWLYGELTA